MQEDEEKKFEAMRMIGACIDRERANEKKLAPPNGTIGVGSADFDHTLRAEAGEAFLRSLRKGSTAEVAQEDSKQAALKLIQWWNKTGCRTRAFMTSRVELHRSEDAASSEAQYWYRKFKNHFPG